jgi:hypothetical protein
MLPKCKECGFDIISAEAFGGLQRIIEEVKEYRKLPSNMIGGNDIDLVESWIKKLQED